MIIDVHAHPYFLKEMCGSEEQVKFRRDNFGLYKIALQDIDLFKRQIAAAGIDKVVLLPLDLSSTTGGTLMSNHDMKDLEDLAPNTFICFGSIDPNSKSALADLHTLIKDSGLKGINFNPSSQHFFPNDKTILYPIYEIAQKYNVPICFHMGMSWEPNSLLQYANPLLLENVAKDFPDLKFSISHFGWPWVVESCILAMKYTNVYIDTSMLYFDSPREFFKYVFSSQIQPSWIDRSLSNKVLFGSNYPRIEQLRMREALEYAGFREETLHKIFELNPIRFLNLQGE